MSKNYKKRLKGKGYPGKELKKPKQSYEEKLDRLLTISRIDYKQSERLQQKLDHLNHVDDLRSSEIRKNAEDKLKLLTQIKKQELKIKKLKRNLEIVTPKKEDKLAGTQIARIMRKI